MGCVSFMVYHTTIIITMIINDNKTLTHAFLFKNVKNLSGILVFEIILIGFSKKLPTLTIAFVNLSIPSPT